MYTKKRVQMIYTSLCSSHDLRVLFVGLHTINTKWSRGINKVNNVVMCYTYM
uniref:Uncharacterized protein n=1 Tax=Triticum urartu TaxID=4572 RepID=A0A8R7TSW5_TRIUA